MKELVSKFDFNDACKALDELDYPIYSKNELIKEKESQPLVERFSKSRDNGFELLFEDAYSITSKTDLEDAQKVREADVAQAKLDRIEKIVDLDADAVEDLLGSYVGKIVIQCPQCKTMFYKKEEDIERSEENPDVVNVSEICQHCGNSSGYEVVGKIAEAPAPETTVETTEETVTEPENELDLNFDTADLAMTEEPTEEADITAEETDTEIATDTTEETTEDEGAEETVEETSEEETEEDKKKKESLSIKTASILNESDAEAATSIEDAQKWVDYDMERYGEISANTNEIIKKAGYQIVKDDHGDYEVIAGDYKESLQESSKLDDIEADADDKKEEAKAEEAKKDDDADADKDDKLASKDLKEDINDELDKKLKEHNDYISYIQGQIECHKEALKKATNEEIKAAIQRTIDKCEEDLAEALPDAVKENMLNTTTDLPTAEEAGIDETTEKTEVAEESLKEGKLAKFRAKLKESKLNFNEEISAEAALARFEANLAEAAKSEEKEESLVEAKLAPEGATFLTPTQVEKLYDVYDFADNEEITTAWFENGKLIIEYIDEDGTVGNYEPNIDEPEDKEKIAYIMTEDLTEAGLWDKIKNVGNKIKQGINKVGDAVASQFKIADQLDNVFDKYQIGYGYLDLTKDPSAADSYANFEVDKAFDHFKDADKYARELSKAKKGKDTSDNPLVVTIKGKGKDGVDFRFIRLYNDGSLGTDISNKIITDIRDTDRSEKAAKKAEEIADKASSFESTFIKKINDKLGDKAATAKFLAVAAAPQAVTNKLLAIKQKIGELEPKQSFNLDSVVDFKNYLEKAKSASNDLYIIVYALDAAGRANTKNIIAKYKAGKEITEALEITGEEVVEGLEDFEDNASLADIENIDEKSFNDSISEYLKEVYENVEDFELEECKMTEDRLICEGKINFKSGKSKKTIFEFKSTKSIGDKKIVLEGFNKDFSDKKAFAIKASTRNRYLTTEALKYKYSINESLVKGHIKNK